MSEKKLFSIGDVARLFHISVSSLRHYENVGLLTPEYTDPSSGYRYYSVERIEGKIDNRLKCLKDHRRQSFPSFPLSRSRSAGWSGWRTP